MVRIMSTTSSKKPNELLIQVIVVIVLLIISAVVLIQLGIFDRSSDEKRTLTLTYKLEGSAAQAVITYTEKDGTTSPKLDVHLPWRLTLSNFPAGQTAILTAGNLSQLGSITCKIIVDGDEWQEESAKYPDDKVVCGGIVSR